jgi:hypothetical protein
VKVVRPGEFDATGGEWRLSDVVAAKEMSVLRATLVPGPRTVLTPSRTIPT